MLGSRQGHRQTVPNSQIDPNASGSRRDEMADVIQREHPPPGTEDNYSASRTAKITKFTGSYGECRELKISMTYV
jgi:hypothetical protein